MNSSTGLFLNTLEGNHAKTVSSWQKNQPFSCRLFLHGVEQFGGFCQTWRKTQVAGIEQYLKDISNCSVGFKPSQPTYLFLPISLLIVVLVLYDCHNCIIKQIEVSFSIFIYYQKYHLPSFDADVDQRCFPMAYAFGKNQPDPLVCCDISNCQVNSDNEIGDITRMNCGHTIHNCCLQTLTLKSSHCPICVPLFDARVKELSEAFNNYLLRQDDEDQKNEDQNDETADTG